jgi:protein-disulfide isomerase
VLQLPGFPVASAASGGAKTTVTARHVEGNPKGAVRVLIYEDLQCPDCSVFRKALDERLLPRYSASVAFEHRDFPLPKHTWAKEAAVAARYFQALNPMLAADFRRTVQGNLGKVNSEGFRSWLIEFCRDRQLDTDKALAALNNSTYAQAVEADYQAGVAAGIRRTPTVIVGGTSFVETIDIGALQRSLDALLGGASGSQ